MTIYFRTAKNQALLVFGMFESSCPLSNRFDVPAPVVFIAQCNREHKILGNLYDDIIVAQNHSFRKQSVAKILRILSMYVKFHFENEEKFMASIGYDETEVHVGIHSEFIHDLDVIIKKSEKNIDVLDDLKSIYYRLENGHIPEIDVKLIDFTNSIIQNCPSATCPRCNVQRLP